MSVVRNDKIYRYLKSDGTIVWFRYDIDNNGAYQFLFQTGTAAGDQTLVAAQAAFTNALNYPGATVATGNVLDGTILTSLSMPDGTAAAPGLPFTNDTDTGIYRPGANQFGITTGGTAALTLDSSGNQTLRGNLTFGTSASVLNGTTGSIGITATGSNQSITLTPSGSGNTIIGGNVLLGGSTNGTGQLQLLSTSGTNAGGITFATDVNLFRQGANSLLISTSASGQPQVLGLQNLLGAAADVGVEFYLAGGPAGTRQASFITGWNGAAVTDAYLDIYTRGGNVLTKALRIDSAQGITLVKKIVSYNGIVTAGNGVATIQGAGTVTAQVAQAASIATYTVGAADADFIVSGNVNVTTSTTHNFTLECAYTDETNTARVVTFNVQQLGGTLITAITNVTGAGPYEGVPLHLRCKAATTITIRTNAAGTYTTVVFNATGVIAKLQ